MTEPLVLIPGLSCDASLYGPQWPELAPGRPMPAPQYRRALSPCDGVEVAPARTVWLGLEAGECTRRCLAHAGDRTGLCLASANAPACA